MSSSGSPAFQSITAASSHGFQLESIRQPRIVHCDHCSLFAKSPSFGDSLPTQLPLSVSLSQDTEFSQTSFLTAPASFACPKCMTGPVLAALIQSRHTKSSSTQGGWSPTVASMCHFATPALPHHRSRIWRQGLQCTQTLAEAKVDTVCTLNASYWSRQNPNA